MSTWFLEKPEISTKTNKTRNDRRRQSCIPKLGGESRALLLVLVLLSCPEGWSQSRSRLGQSVPCNLEPILLDTARRYHEYHATIHWKHESGWSVGIGWLISNRACNSPQRFWLIWTPRGLCLYSSWDCRLSFLFFVCLFVCLFVFLQSKFYRKTLDLGFSGASGQNARLRHQPRIGLDEPLCPVRQRCTM